MKNRIFETTEEIKKWAGVTALRMRDEVVIVQNSEDSLFYVLTPCLGGREIKMTMTPKDFSMERLNILLGD